MPEEQKQEQKAEKASERPKDGKEVAPAPKSPFAAGTVVTAKTSKRDMTVESVSKDGDVTCTYFDDVDHAYHKATYTARDVARGAIVKSKAKPAK